MILEDYKLGAVETKFHALQSEKFIEETFDGSLPKFLTAFATRKKMSEKEMNELQELINQFKG